MKYLLALSFLFGSASMVFSQLEFLEMYKSMAKTYFELIVDHGLTGYNPNLTGDEVLKISCAKPSDKVFRTVYVNDPDMATKLDLSKPIGITTHGWLDNGYSKWIVQISETWVEYHDTNVCRVDWSIYSMVDYITAARRNVKLVGKHMANFINFLHNAFGVAYSNVTMMGHSLGGQICGTTGYYLDGQLGRIIGMDPAGPLFTVPNSVPLEDQLDKTDALFVTVIHSNPYILGVGYSIGHADYYPNAGLPIQPGCVLPLLFGIYGVEFGPVVCSHFRAFKFVHLSLYNNPLCLAIKCNTYSDFLNRKCTDTVDSWGVNSNKIEGDFYFWSGLNPKCTNRYWAIE